MRVLAENISQASSKTALGLYLGEGKNHSTSRRNVELRVDGCCLESRWMSAGAKFAINIFEPGLHSYTSVQSKSSCFISLHVSLSDMLMVCFFPHPILCCVLLMLWCSPNSVSLSRLVSRSLDLPRYRAPTRCQHLDDLLDRYLPATRSLPSSKATPAQSPKLF